MGKKAEAMLEDITREDQKLSYGPVSFRPFFSRLYFIYLLAFPVLVAGFFFFFFLSARRSIAMVSVAAELASSWPASSFVAIVSVHAEQYFPSICVSPAATK